MKHIESCCRMWQDRERRVANCVLVTVSILVGYYSQTNAEDSKPAVTPIESSTGIYFDEVGNVFSIQHGKL
jgi:hypothetical protein